MSFNLDKETEPVDKSFSHSFQEYYKTKAAAKLRRKKQEPTPEDEAKRQKATYKRHVGVLGLGAFISAFPYDVPEFMPEVLMILSDHLHDPQPIPVSSLLAFMTEVARPDLLCNQWIITCWAATVGKSHAKNVTVFLKALLHTANWPQRNSHRELRL